MIQRDYIIIGSGIGGGSACESIRKFDKKGSVTLIGAETYAPYKRWMLSKSFLRDKTAPLKKLPHLEPHWYDAHRIETRFAAMVTQVNIDRRLAVLGNGETIGKWCVGHFIEWIRIMTHDPLVDGVYSMARAVLDADAEVA